MAKGDHVFVKRLGGAYSHHGIDCGDGTVIHYTNQGLSQRRIIERTDLSVFAKDGEVLVRDYTDFFSAMTNHSKELGFSQSVSNLYNKIKGVDPANLDLSSDAVIQRAESRLGETTFHLLFHNCEHFSTWCKTGLHSSDQVNAIWKQVLSAPNFYRYRYSHFMVNFMESFVPSKRE